MGAGGVIQIRIMRSGLMWMDDTGVIGLRFANAVGTGSTSTLEFGLSSIMGVGLSVVMWAG
jgi:hypothetical protein